MPSIPYALPLTAIFLCGGHFGIFLAWVSTTMWGLDVANPRAAIEAMQAMNASVRNGAFAPFFFGAPLVLLLAGAVLYFTGQRVPAMLFGAAGLLVLFGSVVLTMAINVPMNAELAMVEVPGDEEAARAIWQDYSPTWQFWNQMRTLASGLGFALALVGLVSMKSA